MAETQKESQSSAYMPGEILLQKILNGSIANTPSSAPQSATDINLYDRLSTRISLLEKRCEDLESENTRLEETLGDTLNERNQFYKNSVWIQRFAVFLFALFLLVIVLIHGKVILDILPTFIENAVVATWAYYGGSVVILFTSGGWLYKIIMFSKSEIKSNEK